MSMPGSRWFFFYAIPKVKVDFCLGSIYTPNALYIYFFGIRI